jgi:hypothetical protein
MKKQVFRSFNHLIKNVNLVAVSLGILSIVFVGPIHAATDHSDLITSYEGSKTCAPCHPGAADEMLNSIHYKLMGEVQGVYNMFTNKAVEGIHGKGNRY